MTCQKSICLKSCWNNFFISCVNCVHQSYFVTSKNIMHSPRLDTNTYDTKISLIQFLIIKIEVIQILISKPSPLESDDHTMNIQISLCLNLRICNSKPWQVKEGICGNCISHFLPIITKGFPFWLITHIINEIITFHFSRLTWLYHHWKWFAQSRNYYLWPLLAPLGTHMIHVKEHP